MTPLASLRAEAEHIARQLPHVTLQAQASEAAHVGSAGRKRAGSGEHFWQYRRYASEDAADRIDWRRSAKGDQYFVRETELETARTFLFWADPHPGFDWSGEQGRMTKADVAKIILIALGVLLSKEGERIGALGSGRTPSFGKRALDRLGEELCRDPNGHTPPFPGVPKSAAGLVLASDFYDSIETWKKRLGTLAAKCPEGILLAISDPVEIDFPFEGRVKFSRPGEKLSKILGRAETVTDEYKQVFAAHREAIKALASQIGWRFAEHRTGDPIVQNGWPHENCARNSGSKTMTLGPFLFGAPLALLGLIALPIIYWVLRATPPTPKDAALPSMRLLDELDPREETPSRTPLWLLLMRMIAAAAALIGLALPIYAPGAANETGDEGPLLIVIDNGWASAPRWNELVSAADAALDTANRDTPTHLLLTAPRTLNASPSERLTRAEMGRRIASLEPLSWSADRDDALKRLEESGLRPERILWASDGLDMGSGTEFARALSEIAPLSIYAAPPSGATAITDISADPNGVGVTLRRAGEDGIETLYVSALTLDGSALATAEATFEQGRRDTEARFTLPAAALARISRFVATGRQGAGTVWLWDSADRSRRVGLVSLGDIAQPLLSDVHYVRQALKPFATITEGELSDIIASSPDAIILTDIGSVPDTQMESLTNWVESGGALIRFAGPRVAAQGDALVPTPLRRSSRALGGSLAWDEPQKIADFPDTSPFAGLTPPADALVKQQVLAEPAPDLQAKTWARLEDGSPLVTADTRGAGSVILFHVTAGPDWSNLPYSGVFAQMLRRSIAAGKGEAVDDGEGTYAPLIVLDGYGRPDRPADTAAPIAAADFADLVPSEVNPPGLYQGPAAPARSTLRRAHGQPK